MKRIRPTFLLRCVVLAASVGIFVLVVVFSSSRPLTGGVIAFLIVFWLIGIEGGLLPLALEHILVRKARRSAKPVSRLWFVDMEQQRKSKWDSHTKATSNNPTIR